MQVVRLGVTNSRLAPNKLTQLCSELESEGVVRQGKRQAGRELAAAWRQTMRGQVMVLRRIVAIEIRQGTSQISRKINFSI